MPRTEHRSRSVSLCRPASQCWPGTTTRRREGGREGRRLARSIGRCVMSLRGTNEGRQRTRTATTTATTPMSREGRSGGRAQASAGGRAWLSCSFIGGGKEEGRKGAASRPRPPPYSLPPPRPQPPPRPTAVALMPRRKSNNRVATAPMPPPSPYFGRESSRRRHYIRELRTRCNVLARFEEELCELS